ncbi:MAG TPA: acyl carrier protein [Isosphaeraceae bacterium]|nr:acyl carrier protein [Isosphaeraceae bacterium]
MSDASLTAQLAQVVRKVGKVPADRPIENSTRLVEDLGIDSLDLVAVFLQVQDEFDVVIEDDDVVALKTVADLAAYVHRTRGSAAA